MEESFLATVVGPLWFNNVWKFLIKTNYHPIMRTAYSYNDKRFLFSIDNKIK